jgi:predicted small lipoprotein YifL
MRKSLLLRVFALTVVSTFTACGLKGPLYLPKPKPAAPPATAPAPEPPGDDKKSPGGK